MKKLSKSELSQFTLIETSVNRPGRPVCQEDLPPILWGRAPRIVKGQRWFNSLKLKPFYGENFCDSCMSFSKNLDRHELYGLYTFRSDYVIKFEGIMLLCKKCHNIVHKTFSETHLSRYNSLRVASVSKVMKSSAWANAKYLLIEDELYSFSELTPSKTWTPRSDTDKTKLKR